MKLLKCKNPNIPRIIGGILLGFFSRIVYEQVASTTRLTNKKSLSLAQDQQDANCPPCQQEVCPKCLPESVTGTVPTDALPVYKPKGMYEVTRWLYFDENNVYDIINEEPKVALNGHWREDIKAVSQVGLEYINANKMLGHSWALVSLKNGYMRTDSLRGTDYMLDLIVRPTTLNSTKSVYDRTFRVRMVHPFENIDNSRSISVRKEIQGKIKIIVPTSYKSTNVENFLDGYNKGNYDDQIELIFMLFIGNQLEERKQAKALLDRISMKTNVKNIIKAVQIEGQYDFLKGIHYGAVKSANSKDIIIAVNEEKEFSHQFLVHCRAIAEAGKRVYFPIAFEQYNPDVIEKGMPPGKPKNVNKKDHNKFTGYWSHDAHDSICAYQADFISVLSGATTNQEKPGTWLYDIFLRKGMDVFAAVEPHLFRMHTAKTCDKIKLSADAFQKCFIDKAKTLGSKPALGILYITEIVQKKVKH
uniref:Hexosyltransferase n=1 Tax=Phallusia mammillata TaxID=59560 RepID=A0A6F9DA84_9ASCI|nr:Not6 protein [Phallusia mammillata]